MFADVERKEHCTRDCFKVNTVACLIVFTSVQLLNAVCLKQCIEVGFLCPRTSSIAVCDAAMHKVGFLFRYMIRCLNNLP